MKNSVLLRTTFLGLLSILMLSILMLSACRQSPSDPAIRQLSGSWEITAADRLLRKLGETADSASAEDLRSPDQEREQGQDPERNSGGEDLEPKMVLQFDPSGFLKTTTRMGRFDPPSKAGQWKLLAWDEVQQTMNIQCSIAGQTTEHEVRFIEPDLIELVPPNLAGTNSKLRFRRSK